MNIGFVSQALPYLPSRGGFRLYGANLIRCLSRRHRIDLVSLLQDGDEKHLEWPRQYCASVTIVSAHPAGKALVPFDLLVAYLFGRVLRYRRKMATVLRLGMQSQQWDVLHIEGGYAGGIVPSQLPLAKVLSVHDSGTLRCDEMLKCSRSLQEKVYYMLLKKVRTRYQRLAYPRFERCVAVADPDLKAIQKIVPNGNIVLIPYGTDTEYFHPVPVDKNETTLIFHSHLGYPPNVEAALEFANDIFPLIRREAPNATFHLVGADPVPKIQALASRPGIKLSANVADVRPPVCAARIYVSAIRYGTGLKSKILEAMGMRMPIVCYPGSTVGIEAVPGQHLLLAQDPKEFAAHVLDLLRNPMRAEQLAQAGRQLVEEKYSWESRAHAFEELYDQVTGERRAGGYGFAGR